MSKMSDAYDDAMRYWLKQARLRGAAPPPPPPPEPKKTSSADDTEDYESLVGRSAHGSGKMSNRDAKKGYRHMGKC